MHAKSAFPILASLPLLRLPGTLFQRKDDYCLAERQQAARRGTVKAAIRLFLDSVFSRPTTQRVPIVACSVEPTPLTLD